MKVTIDRNICNAARHTCQSHRCGAGQLRIGAGAGGACVAVEKIAWLAWYGG